MTTLSEDQIKYARYKWEFLRRNPEYIKDWKKLDEALEEFWLADRVGSPPGEIMIKDEIEFCKKWKIACQLPPENSYEDYTTHIEERHPIPVEESKDENSIDFDPLVFEVDEWSLTKWSKLGIDLHRIMFDRLFPEIIHSRPFMVEDGWEYEREGDIIRRHFSYTVARNGILTVKIDLNHSKNRSINDFKDFINEWKELYENAFIRYQYRRFCDERGIRSHPINDEDVKKDF